MNSIFIVGVGGFLGSIARYLMGLGVQGLYDPSIRIPLATLIVNVLGSFLIGILFQYLGDEQAGPSVAKLFLATGILGGFTTFSTFSLETFLLLKQGSELLALFNVIAQLVLGTSGVYAGFFSARAVLG